MMPLPRILPGATTERRRELSTLAAYPAEAGAGPGESGVLRDVVEISFECQVHPERAARGVPTRSPPHHPIAIA